MKDPCINCQAKYAMYVDCPCPKKKEYDISCPDCGRELRHEGGCKTCVSCGYSACSV